MLVSAADEFLLFKQIMVSKNLELEMEARNMLMRAFARHGDEGQGYGDKGHGDEAYGDGGHGEHPMEEMAHVVPSAEESPDGMMQASFSPEEEEAMLVEVGV